MPILQNGLVVNDELLTKRCEPVYTAQEARELIRKLEACFNQLDGSAGLSCPQIGIAKQCAIIRLSDHKINLINPVILELKTPFIFCGEGCMSFPGRRWDAPRFKEVYLENSVIWPPDKSLSNNLRPKTNLTDFLQFQKQTMYWIYEHPNEDISNLLPIVIQHEIDHLNGITLLNKEGAVEVSIPKPLISGDRVGRNDPCPCGSSKKFKKCCLNKIPQGKIAVNQPGF